jgi:hypothetical protein
MFPQWLNPAEGGPSDNFGERAMASWCATRVNPLLGAWLRRLIPCVLAAAFGVSFIATSASAQQVPSGCPYKAPAPAFDPQNPNLGQLKLQLREYRCTKYDEELVAKLTEARVWIAQRAGQVAHPAVVLDIDETSLSNWEQIYRNDFGYVPNGACDQDTHTACGQRAWELSADAVAIEPTLALFNAAKALSVAVFFVTGRPESPVERAATEDNLRKAGYRDWNGLFLRPGSTSGQPVADYKSSTRAGIEAGGYRIIANIGDQDSDLAKGYAEKTFKLPNPFYFLP